MKTQKNRNGRLTACVSACCILAACGSAANAQYFQRLFGTTTPETPRGNNQTSNEDHITTGFAQDAAGAVVTYASRHLPDGAPLWSALYREVNNQPSTGWAMLEAFNGDLVVAGQSLGVGPALTLSLMRLGPAGNVLWAGSYENTSFETTDVFEGVRKNVAVEELLDIGFVAVTSDIGGPFPGLTEGRMLSVTGAGIPAFQKVYITNITVVPNGVTFNDLRIQTATPAIEIAVTGTIEFRPQGPGGPVTYEALYARFDLAGNPIVAFSYRFQPAAGGPSFDIYGDGIQTLPGSADVIIMGRTNVFGGAAAGANAAVLRIAPGGAPVWSRAISGIGPSAAAMSRSDFREVVTAGYTGQTALDIGSVALLNVDEAGGWIFSRRYTEPSPGFVSLGRDQVWFRSARPGWAVVGDETDPYTIGMRDVDLLRTDTSGRTGCFERDIPVQVTAPLVQIRQLALLQANRDNFTFRQVIPTDPAWQEKVVCKNDCACPGDANGDGVIDFNDINAVIANWAVVYAPGTGPGDANCDGVVDFNDINVVIANWGSACP